MSATVGQLLTVADTLELLYAFAASEQLHKLYSVSPRQCDMRIMNKILVLQAQTADGMYHRCSFCFMIPFHSFMSSL